MKKSFQYVLMCALTLMFAMTANNSFAKEFGALTGGQIRGVWKFKDPANGPQKLIFLKDGTYHLDFDGDGQKDIWGEYRLSQDWVIMNDVGGDFVFDCGQQGAYSYRIVDDVLTFRMMADQCPSRTQAMSVQWVRFKEHKRVIEPPIMMKI